MNDHDAGPPGAEHPAIWFDQRLAVFADGRYDVVLAQRVKDEPAYSLRLDLLYMTCMRRLGRFHEAKKLANDRLQHWDGAPVIPTIVNIILGRTSVARAIALCRSEEDRHLAYIVHAMTLTTEGRFDEAAHWLQLILATPPAAYFHSLAQAELQNCQRAKTTPSSVEDTLQAAEGEELASRHENALRLRWNAAYWAWTRHGADHWTTAVAFSKLAEGFGPRDEELAGQLQALANKRVKELPMTDPIHARHRQPWLDDPACESDWPEDTILEGDLVLARLQSDNANVVKIRALRAIPPFLGPGQQLMKLDEGDLAEVYEPVAELLVSRHCAERVPGESGAPSERQA